MYWTPGEVMSFLKEFGYECTVRTAFHLFNQIDLVGEGKVEFEDFFEFITTTRPIVDNDGKLKTIFYKFSKQKEYLDEQDMIRICRDHSIGITEEQAVEMFYKLSPSSDPQKIGLEDFMKLVQKSSGDRMKGI
jgi:Ca2+-binding EF-hand superfamily protein